MKPGLAIFELASILARSAKELPEAKTHYSGRFTKGDFVRQSSKSDPFGLDGPIAINKKPTAIAMSLR
jgi:hypothetical protein